VLAIVNISWGLSDEKRKYSVPMGEEFPNVRVEDSAPSNVMLKGEFSGI
jgi:hypothetical protein